MSNRYDDYDPSMRFYRKKCHDVHIQKVQDVKKVLHLKDE